MKPAAAILVVWCAGFISAILFSCIEGQQQCTCSTGCAPKPECPGGNCNKENVAYDKPASMSSQWPNTAPACGAVNGRTSGTLVFEDQQNPNCVNSRDNQGEWWQVDLGQNYTVTDIVVYNRDNDQRRIAGTWIYVDTQLCFQFPNSADVQDHDMYTISCGLPLRGHLVTFSKNGTVTVGHKFIQFCEVQIWVCKVGWYGVACNQECSKGCLNGACDNYWGTCLNGCVDGYYGNTCNNTCGACKDNVVCDAVTGRCPHGCQLPGFQPPLCKEPCSNKTYGDNCNEPCGHCAGGASCDVTDGHCQGCEGNFTPPLCKTCANGFYGHDCAPCGHCQHDNCDQNSGHCMDGCRAGYKPPICQEACSNKTYGDNCNEPCGHCAGGASCDVTNGRCQDCEGNFSLPLCKTCANGFYGHDCAPCGHCQNDNCEQDTGRCVDGCRAGYKQLLCQEACENGTYGENCALACGQCEGQATCDVVNGSCAACHGDLTLPFCKSALMSPTSSDNNAIIGGVVGGVVAVLLVVVAVVIFIFYRRKRNKREATSSSQRERHSDNLSDRDRHVAQSFETVVAKEEPLPKQVKPSAAIKPTKLLLPKNKADREEIYENFPQHRHGAGYQGQSEDQAPGLDDVENDILMDDSNALYGNDEDIYATFRAATPRLDRVQKYLVDRLASGGLRAEFMTIPKTIEDEPKEAGNLEINFRKNRFAQVIPYDRCRAILKDDYKEGKATDYINASYITGYRAERKYIAAQGPRENTITDFWRMLWQEKITHIVMLTNIIEDGKPKCEQYWPEKEGGQESYGPLTVNTTQLECRNNFYIRTLSVKRAVERGLRTITQYHYVSWSDHGVPTTTSLVSFWRYVATRSQDDPAPLLVHCSAGVGRTGTFIGLDIGVETAVHEGHVDIPVLVNSLRQERTLMVQAVVQYVFLYEALLEAYTSRDTLLSLEQFETIFPRPIVIDNTNERIDKELQALKQLQLLTSDTSSDTASAAENREKNRNSSDLPLDKHLVHLTEHVPGRNQYINAVYMPTLRDSKGSILTQLPLPSTQVDFWRLVYGNDVTAVVSLSSPHEETEVKPYCHYWPRETSSRVQAGPYVITLLSKTILLDTITSYSLNVHKQKITTNQSVQLLHYNGWTGEVGGRPEDMMKLLDTLVKGSTTSQPSRVVIQCSDGVGKCGLFAALYNIVSHMTYDREVDVYMNVRQVHAVSPRSVTSLSQYRYCYQMAQICSKESNVYANL